MPVYFNGVPVDGVDATELDGVPALLTPLTGKNGYVVTLDDGDLILAPTAVVADAVERGTFAGRPASPAVGDAFYAYDFDVLLTCAVAGTWRFDHGGPLAVTRGPIPSGAGNWIAGPANIAAGPVCGPGTSLAIGLNVASLPGATAQVLAENIGSTGWVLGVSGSTANRVYLRLSGINSFALVELGDLAVGSWALALSISTTEIRWSINGGVVGSAAISGTYSPPDATARFLLGNHVTGNFAFATGSFAWFGAWGSVLSDGALVATAAAHATYLPGASGAVPTAAWLAGQSPHYDTVQQLNGAQGVPLTLNPSATVMGWTAR